MDSRIRKAIDFMGENLNRKLTEKNLASINGLTPQHFCVLFKAQSAETPMRYLRTLRLERAREFLNTPENSNRSIKEIAALVGYDFSHFVRDFEKRFGQSPARYRASK